MHTQPIHFFLLIKFKGVMLIVHVGNYNFRVNYKHYCLFVHQPSWTMSIQVMTFEQAEKFAWNPFDLTKVP